MYSNELTSSQVSVMARQYVNWLYYFHHNNINGRTYPLPQLHDMCAVLLDYEPSVHRDHVDMYWFEVVCLKCGIRCTSGRSRTPHTSECYHCTSHKFVKESAILGRLPVNPMAHYFHMLPVVVQEQVYYILLDTETHLTYNTRR